MSCKTCPGGLYNTCNDFKITLIPDASSKPERTNDQETGQPHKKVPEGAVQDKMTDVKIEIQLMSPWMWAYSSLDHDILYKGLSGEVSEEKRRALSIILGAANVGAAAVEHFGELYMKGLGVTTGRGNNEQNLSDMEGQNKRNSPANTKSPGPIQDGRGGKGGQQSSSSQNMSYFPQGKVNYNGEEDMQKIVTLAVKQALELNPHLEQLRRKLKENKRIISWVSSEEPERDDNQARAKLGRRYSDSGQWLRGRVDG